MSERNGTFRCPACGAEQHVFYKQEGIKVVKDCGWCGEALMIVVPRRIRDESAVLITATIDS